MTGVRLAEGPTEISNPYLVCDIGKEVVVEAATESCTRVRSPIPRPAPILPPTSIKAAVKSNVQNTFRERACNFGDCVLELRGSVLASIGPKLASGDVLSYAISAPAPNTT